MLDSTSPDRAPRCLRTRGAERWNVRLQRKAAKSETLLQKKQNEQQKVWGGDNIQTCHVGYLSTPGAVLKAFLLLAMLSLGLFAITAAVTRKKGRQAT